MKDQYNLDTHDFFCIYSWGIIIGKWSWWTLWWKWMVWSKVYLMHIKERKWELFQRYTKNKEKIKHSSKTKVTDENWQNLENTPNIHQFTDTKRNPLEKLDSVSSFHYTEGQKYIYIFYNVFTKFGNVLKMFRFWEEGHSTLQRIVKYNALLSVSWYLLHLSNLDSSKAKIQTRYCFWILSKYC